MKTILLNLLAVFALATVVSAQTTYMDFETVSPIAYDFGGNTHQFMVDNPDKTGNTSDKVGMVTTGHETWSGDALPIGGTINFSDTADTFTMDVYSKDTGDVIFKVEKVNQAEIAAEVTASYKNAETWETLEFVFPDTLKAEVYGQIVLFFNFGTSDSTVWYFDNVAGPSATFGSNTMVNFVVDDKLGEASDIKLDVEGEELALSADGNKWKGSKELAPYNIAEGGGEYQIIIMADGENYDTTKLSITTGGGSMNWNYLLLDEEPEDGTAQCKYTTTPPTIDGEIDDMWGGVKAHPLQKREWWGSPTGLYSWFKVMWSDDNLYVLNYVEDDTLVKGAANPWENDNVELFFDMDRAKANDGEGFDENDYQIRYIWNDDSWTGSDGIDETWATSNGVERAQSNMDDPNGYVMEWKIPWDALAEITEFVPIADSKFDFDITIADNQGTGRAYIISWNTTADQNYNNTSLYGTITLSDEEVSTSINKASAASLSIYPNPASSQVTIANGSVIQQMVVTNIIGKEIININPNSENVNLNVENLQKGIYILSIEDINGSVSSQRLIVE